MAMNYELWLEVTGKTEDNSDTYYEYLGYLENSSLPNYAEEV